MLLKIFAKWREKSLEKNFLVFSESKSLYAIKIYISFIILINSLYKTSENGVFPYIILEISPQQREQNSYSVEFDFNF